MLRVGDASAETQRAFRRIARLESSEREGTVRPMILDAVFEIFSSLFFSETEREGKYTTLQKSQLREENFFGESRVVRAQYMSHPPELSPHDESLYARQARSAEHIGIWDPVFPEDAHDLAQALNVELV